ncbi:hypothetical protein GKZ27_08005 [Enterorhabdus mucosicola]|uniref:Uncharacterized protein n=1 Tax=Adlercreutzia mucosicola TaxID=580026 RepID=A0A6N8JRM9_9ACTN|nr:hypothetical protein [Adlercreutzia mucosicola]MVX61396.1 hypothetical protein [Adlercreutzia mucosicola]
MTWGKRREAAATRSGAPLTQGRRPATATVARLGHRALAATLAALLAVALLPALPATEGTAPRTAEALTGTTDYSKVLKATNLFGEPALIQGSTMRMASTLDDSHYTDYGAWGSAAGFVSTDKISLLHNWEIRFSGRLPIGFSYQNIDRIMMKFAPGFIRGPELSSSSGYAWNYKTEWRSSTSSTATTIYLCEIVNGMEKDAPKNPPSAPLGKQQMSFAYNARTDRATLKVGSSTLDVPNVRTNLGTSAYLYFVGIIEWATSAGAPQPSAPANLQLEATFDSMTLPNLDPEISDITLYRYNDATDAYDILVGEDDVLERDEVVQARCTIRNRNAAASAGGYSEQFGMHLKLADTEAAPTRGIEPFADGAHPLQVNGSTVATAPGPNTLTGANGVPITLTGNQAVDVTYYARVNQAGGQAVTVSHELVEDSFQGSQFKTVELLAEQPLKPAPDDVDPDDPASGAGKDFHYTRLPRANENGWNNSATSPVRVTFYAGDFDRFTVAAADGTALGELGDREAWVRADDTDGLPITLQASSASGAVSSKGSDTIRIDTQAPALSWDADAGALTANDEAPAGSGKATSGVWKVRRVKADGRPLATEDVTPGNVGAAAFGAEGESATSSAAEGTEWTFTLADGKGNPRETIADAQPGFYVAEDAAGNVSAPFEVKDPSVDPGPDEPEGPTDPDDTDKPGTEDPDDPGKPDKPGKPGPGDTDPNPGPTAPTFPAITPRPDGSGAVAPEPLAPIEVTTDSASGLTHAVVRDELALPTSSKAVTPDMMAQLIDERYLVGTGLTDSAISRGPVRLFDSAGNPVDAIDRSKPGTWIAEQTFTDAAGNTTTLRLTITVRDDAASGTLGAGTGNGGGTGGKGSTANGHRTALANHISQLPQTGGILGACPLHILFVLMALMASAYSLGRLRQRRQAEREGEREHTDKTEGGNWPDAPWLQAEDGGSTASLSGPALAVAAQDGTDTEGLPRDGGSNGPQNDADNRVFRFTMFDGIVLGAITLCAIALGALGFCPVDPLFAAATVLIALFWTWRLARTPHRPQSSTTSRPGASVAEGC